MKLTVKQLKRLIMQEVKANYNARNMDKHIGLDQANARFDLDQANAEIYDDGKDENPNSFEYRKDIENSGHLNVEAQKYMENLHKFINSGSEVFDELPDSVKRDMKNLFIKIDDFLGISAKRKKMSNKNY